MLGTNAGEIVRNIGRILTGKRMIYAKSEKDLHKMREVGELIAEVRETLRGMVQIGISTFELNAYAEKAIRDQGAYPTFIGYHGFQFAICASPNNVVVDVSRYSDIGYTHNRAICFDCTKHCVCQMLT